MPTNGVRQNSTCQKVLRNSDFRFIENWKNFCNRYKKLLCNYPFKLNILQRLTLVSQFSIVQENLRFSAHTSRKIAPIRTTWQSHFVWSLTRSTLLQYSLFEKFN